MELNKAVEVAEAVIETEKKLEKPTMDPVEVYRRNVKKMPDRVLSAHLRRKARAKGGSLMDGALATILSTVFDSKASAYLR